MYLENAKKSIYTIWSVVLKKSLFYCWQKFYKLKIKEKNKVNQKFSNHI